MSNEDTETEVVDPRGVEIENFDPIMIEQEMLAQAESRAADPIETASSAYAMYVPHFKRLLPTLSTRGLRRVLNFLILHPLEQDAMNSANEDEKSFMHLVNSLVEAKFIMVMASFHANAQAVYDAQNAPLTPEQQAEVVETLRAGGVPEEEITKMIEANKAKQGEV